MAMAGYRVGLFTSPHLSRFHERIQMSFGPMWDDQALAKRLTELRELWGEALYAELSFFEITTLLAMDVFCQAQCEWVILEVGLGGRLDATNAFDPVASVLTSVDLDHQKILGETLKEIALEKLGILRPYGKFFFGGTDDPGVQQCVKEQAHQLHCSFYELPVLPRPQGSYPPWVQHGGRARQKNFDLASLVYQTMAFSPGLDQLLALGFPHSKTPWPYSGFARLQPFQIEGVPGSKGVIEAYLDVSHNPASVAELCRVLLQGASGHLQGVAAVSILKDKDIKGLLDLYTSYFKHVVLFANQSPRSFHKADLPDPYQGLKFFDNFPELITSLLRHLPGGTCLGPLTISGSLFAVGEVISYFDALPKTPYFHPTLHGRWPAALVL
jgi:dihydrofolate synthase/folylpolyglutamate synthase